ncbi:MAG: isochorismatase family protein [Pseudoxanthomonas sp.]
MRAPRFWRRFFFIATKQETAHMETALLVIDMQRSLLDEGPWEKDRLLDNVGLLIERARSAGAPVLFVCDTRVGPDAAIDHGLGQEAGDSVIYKDFCDSFLGTRLHSWLRDAGMKRLVVCGMQTDYCIDTTCRRAASLGYGVRLASDAHSTFDHEALPADRIVAHHNRILRSFPAGAGHVGTIASAEVGFA